MKDDVELIYEKYISEAWGYTNIDYPTNNKYSNIPVTKDSYYQQGHCPTSPGQATVYTIQQENNEEIKLNRYVYWSMGNVLLENEHRDAFVYLVTEGNIIGDEDHIKKTLCSYMKILNYKYNILWNALDQLYFIKYYTISSIKNNIEQLAENINNQKQNRPAQQILFFNNKGLNITNNVNILLNKQYHKINNKKQLEFNF